MKIGCPATAQAASGLGVASAADLFEASVKSDIILHHDAITGTMCAAEEGKPTRPCGLAMDGVGMGGGGGQLRRQGPFHGTLAHWQAAPAADRLVVITR